MDYLQYFNIIFKLFNKMRITFNKRKLYLGYLLIILLKQKVNNLSLLILKEKIKVILKFKFFKMLKNLEVYLNLIK